jgi:Dolichyl-phosphate-mannose-protein mannosyltransferase
MKLVIRWRPLALVFLGFLAFALRIYGLNWDQGNSFHPDERQILFHVTALSWPTSIAQFLDPVKSPLNPHFFAYGSFPIYLLALVGGGVGHFFPTLNTFAGLTLVGRAISALFDSGTILLTGWLGLLLVPDTMPGKPNAWNVALLAATLVVFTPLQLQLSHFYAVDTMLLFFVMLALVASVQLVSTEKVMLWSCLVGVSYGLALATKFSAAPLAVSITVALLLRWWRERDWLSALITSIYTSLIAIIVFLIVQPYALLDRQNFVAQVTEQGNLARGMLDLPYVRQFAGTIPFIYQGQNMVLWGMGVTLGIAALVGLLWVIWHTWRYRAWLWLVVLSWVVVYGAIVGSFYVKFMRYMLPLYPLLTIMAATALLAFVRFLGQKDRWLATPSKKWIANPGYALLALVLAGTIFQGLALLNVYSDPNTRVQASLWMYSHIRAGSTLTYEQWDDPLPVAVDGHVPEEFVQFSYLDAEHNTVTGLDLYGDDTTAKARLLAGLLPKIDVITMPTDRLDKSIPRLPQRYPLTIRYYQLLFSGQLGFHLAAQFSNQPHLLGVRLDDSGADESYSVFDHPTARIFVRDTPYPYTSEQLYQKLLDGVHLAN